MRKNWFNDANGNLTSDSTGRQFSWNAQDQLTQLQFPTVSALMGYDPMGRRATFSKGSQNKSFFYLGQSLLSDGSSKFLHGSGIDQPLQMENSTSSLSYLSDHLGSTSQLVDGNATRKARYDYQSYGKLEGNSSNSLVSNPFTYTAREDDGTGLLYYRARYYDPELEVFISQDPLGDAQRYVSGNPMKLVDPSGLVDLLFNNTAFGHISILSEPTIQGNDSYRYVYGNGLGQGPTTYQGKLLDRDKPLPGFNDYIVELDPKIFGQDPEYFNPEILKGQPYTLIPTPISLTGNCSGYAGEFLNQGLRKKGLSDLRFTLTPGMLLLELQTKGYIKRIYQYR